MKHLQDNDLPHFVLFFTAWSKYCQRVSSDWEALADRRTLAPFVPEITDELDVSNFAAEFTNMPPVDSPAAAPVNGDKLFQVSATDAARWLSMARLVYRTLLGGRVLAIRFRSTR